MDLKVQYNVVSQLQKTLKGKTSSIGVGLHSGKRAKLTICPAPIDTGYVFIRTDMPAAIARVKAFADFVTATQLGTTITNAHGVSVATIEHILAALNGMGIDNAIIEIDGPEVPILDGSSEPFVEMISSVGLRTQAAPRRHIEVLQTIEVKDGNKFARLEPYDGFSVEVEIHFAAKIIGHQRGKFEIAGSGFADDLARARTFGFLHQIDEMRAKGLGLGGSIDNAIVIDGDEVLNENGLRFDDEFARHKALDAVGDLALAGAPLKARYVSRLGGHALNVALVKALLANPDAWRWSVAPLNVELMAAAGI